tara:strand:- start:15669 stop:16103 length:435 start_codon:yes stop_codon:yes gene_type:complete
MIRPSILFRPFAVIALALLLQGCCITKVVLRGDGNLATGTVGGEIQVEACTPMEKEVANQLSLLSDWYRLEFTNCKASGNPAECMKNLAESYTTQKDALLELLEAMKTVAPSKQRSMLVSHTALVQASLDTQVLKQALQNAKNQ